MKKKYLAVYDYGQGGVWLYMTAESSADIKAKFPELDIVDTEPEWLKGEFRQTIERNRTFDIDAPPTGWLKTLVDGRSS